MPQTCLTTLAFFDQLKASDLLLVAGLALLTMWMLMRIARKRRAGEHTVTPTEQVERNRQMRGMRADLEELMVEIEQLAKRFGAQLDAKAAQLEKLVDDADQRIAQLQQLQAGEKPASSSATSTAASRKPATASTSRDTSPTDDDDSETKDPLARSVYQLADAGKEPVQIATELNEHVGKVELILALRETR